MLTAIVAMDKNDVIGVNGVVPWDCSADRKFFKEYIKGKFKIVGRKTWDSVRQYKWANKGIIVFSKDKITIYNDVNFGPSYTGRWDDIGGIDGYLNEIANIPDEVVVIGGAEIYSLAAPYVSKLIVTTIPTQIEYTGDVTKFNWAAYL